LFFFPEEHFLFYVVEQQERLTNPPAHLLHKLLKVDVHSRHAVLDQHLEKSSLGEVVFSLVRDRECHVGRRVLRAHALEDVEHLFLEGVAIRRQQILFR